MFDEYSDYIISKSGRKHEIMIEFDYTIENDGIGAYEYWGAKGFDRGQDYADIDEVINAWIIHSGNVDSEEDIPKLKDIKVWTIISRKDNKKSYHWEHRREIDLNSDFIDEMVEKAMENYELPDAY